MKEILLNTIQTTSENYKKYVALVDDEDFEYLNKYKWHVHFRHGNYYVKSAFFSVISSKTLKMMRLIVYTYILIITT